MGRNIIVMSAYGQRRITDALKAGADGIVEKPIVLDSFLETVRSKLGARVSVTAHPQGRR